MNEMAVNSSTYSMMRVSESNQLNKVEGFDQKIYASDYRMRDRQEKYYTGCSIPKLWFRLKYPQGKIVKKLIKLTDKHVVFTMGKPRV